MIRRLREYYRQFEELSPEEISAELRERRDEERSRSLAEVPALDLTTPAWHEPPDAEAVNAATYALRRAVNAYPDDGPLREALAARHDVSADQIAPGHGAGEILHAAFRAIDAPRVAIAWPGWGPLPRLVHEAGGAPIPIPLTPAGAADVDALAATGAEAIALCTPNDPTGATVAHADLLRLATTLPEATWLIIDAALTEFEPPKGGLSPPGDRPPYTRPKRRKWLWTAIRTKGGQTPLLRRVRVRGDRPPLVLGSGCWWSGRSVRPMRWRGFGRDMRSPMTWS